ncbi:hypothetical protein CEUSTIGMA_g9555.t1 [Chlamydomonas eustigma]|uniref:Methylthioribose-1-phosphate isomerase n=1 Tax=Chlamydomonas eustigma TaxID=1157962 RepID=A0A250XGC9_9CHLO|nr:hypothetical protein CEUSTIGMA_g9555.t1 [Chlamydomonas eustigma]|eukprot:GAX82127.1 hypothetical protein CEUSTIGMA_g9555.t1 [Chlamydomonas eustigma]
MALQAIKYETGSLQLLDQRLLPFDSIYLDVPTPQIAWIHIKDMVVRGAPAIGVTGALALAVDLTNNKSRGSSFSSVQEAVSYIFETLDYLVTSRPTAVNLADSALKLKAVTNEAASKQGSTAVSVVEAVVAAAETFLEADIAANRAMGAYGAKALLEASQAAGKGLGSGRLRVLTHCNTGSLATAGFGTALGVIRALHEQGKLEHAFCTETRPYNQGARLTAFELLHDGLPSTLICDSAAASLMGSGQVDAVVVGADRVVANGDSANKIGTYALSILASYHKVPFFIAAPSTTLDPGLQNGSQIVIEQRPSEEMTHFRGQRVVKEGVQVWNPSFDVAPAALITGIITEKGLIHKQPGDASEFAVRDFMLQNGLLTAEASVSGKEEASTTSSQLKRDFLQLFTETVHAYILQIPMLQQLVGPVSTASTWKVREVGDGNINFVYIVEGPAGSLCIKQSLPFVRCVGDSWPLTQDRSRIEVQGLVEAAKHAPRHTPKVHHFDSKNAIIVMQYLAPPFIILRRGLIEGKVYNSFAEHITEYMACTLFNTSTFKLDADSYRANVVKYVNSEMCLLTEKVIFAEPYIKASNNRYSPQIEDQVQQLQHDAQAKVAISILKDKFMHQTEALLHGDLHTGSIMVTESETYVIDPEFGFYGPIAFDVAKIVGELLLTLFASYGQEMATPEISRKQQQVWILSTITTIWNSFVSKFQKLWSSTGLTGDSYPIAVHGPDAPAGSSSLQACQQAYFERLFQDVLGFAGAIMIRRIVGISHVADIDEIADVQARVSCERRALAFGKVLLIQILQQSIQSIEALISEAENAANN